MKTPLVSCIVMPENIHYVGAKKTGRMAGKTLMYAHY